MTSVTISSAFTSINSSVNFEILEICCAYRVIKDQPSPTYCLFISVIKIPLPLVSDRKESVWELRGISRRQKTLWTLISLFSLLKLVKSEEWGLQDFFLVSMAQRNPPRNVSQPLMPEIPPCIKLYKINIGCSAFQNVFIQYLSFQNDYKVGWGCSSASGSENQKCCCIMEKENQMFRYINPRHMSVFE